jgi:hypothetical protein
VTLARRFKFAWHVAWAKRSFAEDRYSKALEHIDRLKAADLLGPTERFWRCYPLFALGLFEEGEEIIDGFARSESDDVDEAYLALRARAIRASYEGQETLKTRLLKEASKLSPSKNVTRWLEP